MKIKQEPGDFRVDELTDIVPGNTGEYALYRLEKTGWTTPDAISMVRRRWQLDLRRVSYGGLKDRHAVTRQHLTVFRGPQQNLTQDGVDVEYLGRVEFAFTAEHIRANRFIVTMRHLKESDLAAALVAAEDLGRAGVPNYFDDQRFGSVGRGNTFVAREMVRGNFEAALKLALAEPYAHDRPPAKREKQLLRDRWGDWPGLKASLLRGHARSLVDYLVTHPTDFKGAVARLRPELGGLYLAAYQSYLWNRVLDRWLRARCSPESLGAIELAVGRFAVPLAAAADALAGHADSTLPLPSARLKVSTPEIDAVLADEGLTLSTLKVPGLQKPYFSKGDRPAFLRPAGVSADPGDDALNRGRKTLTLRFDLPRGGYATMIVKRLTAVQLEKHV